MVWLAGLVGGQPPTLAQTAEATVALCREPVAGARYSVVLPQLDGAALNLVVVTKNALPEDAGCKSEPTGVSINEISWLGVLSTDDLHDDARIALSIREPEQEIVTLEVDRPSPSTTVRRLVPRAEILPFSKYRIFGREERVAAQPDVTAFDIVCRPGNEPAGVVFDLGAAFPEAALAVEFVIGASAGFRAQIISFNQEAPSEGQEIPSHGGGNEMLTLTVPHAAEAALVLTCPKAEGRLRIEKGTVRAAASKSLDRPGAWVWEPDVWRGHPAELLKLASKLGLGKIYITVPIAGDHVFEPGRLVELVTAAHAAHIDVVAVEGDPDMISGEGRAKALARARALAAHNASAAPETRLDGVQYDIEPYLGAAFGARSKVVWELWAETLQQLSAALGERVEAVVPYWLLESRGASGALERVAPALSRLTIMAYRTNSAAIVSAAAPLLAWTARHRLPATVALEAGTLAQEQRKVYIQAPEGDLHVIRFDDVAAVVMLERVRAGWTGRTYKFSHSVSGSTSRVSFNHDTAALLSAATEVAPDLAAWPSIERLAFHGLPEVNGDGGCALAGSRGSH